MLDAIVPAHNEEQTLGDVVRALVESRRFRVIVVDDGSTDRTTDVARQAGACVLRLQKNRGKGGAMQAALAKLPRDVDVAFFDADLVGFRPEHAELLASEFRRLSPDQLVGMRDHFGPLFSSAQLVMPLMSGDRIVKRWVLDALPPGCWSGYAIETAMNFTVDRHGGVTALVPMAGVTIRNKVSKVGWLSGMAGNLRMLAQMRRTRQALGETRGAACRT